jgi:HEAT repeat protein
MKTSGREQPFLPLAALYLVLVLSCVVVAAIDKAGINNKLSAVVNYERGMDTQPLIAVERLIRDSQNQPEQRKYIERRLAELLAGATIEGKSFICKQLWFIGTAESVPAVAKLLTDEETADMACYAIGQNPSPEAGQALRDALGKASPKLQMRIINLLGDRHDILSVKALGEFVFGKENQVAEAAVAALGKIGGSEAMEILVRARAEGDSDLRFAATDAYLRCAEGLVAEGKANQASVIYKELAGKDETAIIRSAAIKGLADTGGREAVPIVIAAMQDQYRMVCSTARGCVRTMKGEGVTELFASELLKKSPAEQVLLIDALADRGDPAALSTIIELSGDADSKVREAVLHAVGKLGDASSIELLVQAAAGANNSEEKSAAMNSLTVLAGDGVDNAIVKAIQNSHASVRSGLIQVLYDRNATGAVPALLAETENPDSKVRSVAFKALSRLAGEKDMPSLVKILVRIKDDGGRRDAERAAIAVSRKINDENSRADAVLAALHVEERVLVKCSLLRVLGGIANRKALETVVDASKETNPAVRDAAVRELAKWPDAAAAEVLLDIYLQTENQIHRLLALRGFVRLLAQPAQDWPAEKMLEMCRMAMGRADSAAEKKLVLSGLANVSDAEALIMVEPFLQNEEIRAEAEIAAIKIAGAIAQTNPGRAQMAINKLLADVQDENLRRQAEDVLRQIQESEADIHKP